MKFEKMHKTANVYYTKSLDFDKNQKRSFLAY